MLYHGLEGPLSYRAAELLRRPGLRVNVLLALRDDALAELDEFAGRIPELFSNLLRLDRLDREAGRAAILGPLGRYSELAGEAFTAEDALVEAVLDEASTDAGVEAPYLQLVLERLWEREREAGSRELRSRPSARSAGRARSSASTSGVRSMRCRSPSRRRRHGSSASSSRRRGGRSRTSRPTSPSTPTSRTPSCGAARAARTRADRPRRQRDAGRADALRDLPRRPRAADPRVAGRAPAAARADSGRPPAPPPARDHRREPRRAGRRRRRSRSTLSSSEATRGRRRGAPAAASSPAARSRTSPPIRRSASASRCGPPISLRDARPRTFSARASRAMREKRIMRLGGNIVTAAFEPRGGCCWWRRATGGSAIYSSAGRRQPIRSAARLTDGGMEPRRPLLRDRDLGGNVSVRRPAARRRSARSRPARRSRRSRSARRRCSSGAARMSGFSISQRGRSGRSSSAAASWQALSTRTGACSPSPPPREVDGRIDFQRAHRPCDQASAG